MAGPNVGVNYQLLRLWLVPVAIRRRLAVCVAAGEVACVWIGGRRSMSVRGLSGGIARMKMTPEDAYRKQPKN